MLLPLDRECASSFHEAVKRDFLVPQPDGSAFIQPAPGINVDDPYLTARALTLAWQLGDHETADGLRSHVEANYEPTLDPQTGEFHYGFQLGEPIPRGQYNSHIMLSEIGEPGGWERMFQEPGTQRFEEPTVCGIDYPRMGLSEAWYDVGSRTLRLRTYAATPGAAGSWTRFRVTNLKDPGNCRVLMDESPYDGFQIQSGELEIECAIGENGYQIIEGST